MKHCLALMLFCSSSASADELIGSIFPPYPDGFSSVLTGCIFSARHDQPPVCDHAIGVIRRDADGVQFVYGGPLATRDPEGPRAQIIMDAFPLPVLPMSSFLAMGNCEVNGIWDRTLLVALRPTEDVDEEWHTEALWALRYDVALEAFVELPSGTIRCMNEAL